MHCNYLNYGIVLNSNNVVTPCCNFSPSEKWNKDNNIKNLELKNWHKTDQFVELKKLFKKNIFPKECNRCKFTESLNREDSLRKNFNKTSKNNQINDIFLEITPGSTCNLACFTCNPESSSKIRFYHKKLNPELVFENLIDCKEFSFLENIKNKIVQVTLLGGESFYDKNCLKFLDWAVKNLNCKILIFTNGSYIDYEILSKFTNVTLIFSIDAIEDDAQYIRNGSDWEEIKKNYLRCRELKNVSTFVQITESSYNIFAFHKLMDFLIDFYPECVMISIATQQRNHIDLIPISFRKEIQDNIKNILKKITKSNLKKNEKIKILKILASIDERLKNLPWNEKSFLLFYNYTKKMNSIIKPKYIPSFICDLINFGDKKYIDRPLFYDIISL